MTVGFILCLHLTRWENMSDIQRMLLVCQTQDESTCIIIRRRKLGDRWSTGCSALSSLHHIQIVKKRGVKLNFYFPPLLLIQEVSGQKKEILRPAHLHLFDFFLLGSWSVIAKLFVSDNNVWNRDSDSLSPLGARGKLHH